MVHRAHSGRKQCPIQLPDDVGQRRTGNDSRRPGDTTASNYATATAPSNAAVNNHDVDHFGPTGSARGHGWSSEKFEALRRVQEKVHPCDGQSVSTGAKDNAPSPAKDIISPGGEPPTGTCGQDRRRSGGLTLFASGTSIRIPSDFQHNLNIAWSTMLCGAIRRMDG